MEKVIGNIIAQFKDFFGSLPPIKRNSILLATVIAAIGLVVVVSMMSSTSYAVLFRNVPADQLGIIVDNLKKKNISFTLSDEGHTIMVPASLLHATQMAIMTEVGDSQLGSVGLELFEKQDFGVTTFAQRINFQRALQGELMRAINSLSVVKQSKVILAIPAKKVFLEEGGKAKASVVVSLQPGKRLSSDQIRGISFLVSSSVEGLDVDDVTVVNARGKVLSKHFDGDGGGASAYLVELKRKTESEMEDRVESILQKVVGAGKVIAKVSVGLNARSVSSVEEVIDPDKTAIRSAVTEEELLDGSRTNPSGIPGARANLPGAGEQGQVGFKQNVRKELKTTNYAVPKTTRRVNQSAGEITSISVAVLVDGVLSVTKDQDGKVIENWKERTPEELTKYRGIVLDSLGIDEKRGDRVRVENIRFQKEDFTMSEQILTTLERKKLLHSLFKWSLMGFSLALFFFIVVRPFMRWVTESFQDTVEDMLPRTIEELEELQSVDNSLPGMSGALPALEESIDPNKAESELLRERIMTMLEGQEAKAGGAFSLWVTKRES